MPAIRAADLGIPEVFNAATLFIDRHIDEGRGDAVAIECGDERVTYAQLHERVNRFGSALRTGLGVRPEERVLLLLRDEPAFAYAFFGTMKIGAVAVPANTLLKPADYEYLLADTRATVLVVSEALLPAIATIAQPGRGRLRHVVVARNASSRTPLQDGLMSLDDLLASGTPGLSAERTSRDEPAFWLYSSGSTGQAKGCVHLHHDMAICAELVAHRTLGLTRADRCFSVAKLFFAYGLGNALYFPLYFGATAILWPGAPAAAAVFEVIERHKPTVFYSVPTSYGMLLAHTRDPEFDLSSIRVAVSAGEALPPALFERFRQRFGIQILDGIGSTEALHMFISNRPGRVRVGSSGELVDGYEARLLDQDGRVTAEGEIGNLWISGDSVCAAYWNKHEKTQETIQGAWLRTGDKYSRDADGYYWYAGRSDDMLKVGGQWVSPVEVENVLLRHPAVRECGVVGREDRDALIKPMAFVVLHQDGVAGSIDAAALQQFVCEHLADYKRPRWIAFIPELPKTATGKIQRFKLREMAGHAGAGGA